MPQENAKIRRKQFAGAHKMTNMHAIPKRKPMETIDGNIQILPRQITLMEQKSQGQQPAKKFQRSKSIELLCNVYQQISIEKNNKIPNDVINIDQEKCEIDPYARDAHKYMKKLEDNEELRTKVDYLQNSQRSITNDMRATMIDWLIQVQHYLELLPETIYKTVMMLDRFLSVRKVSGKNFQLVGLTCLFIASKFAEDATRVPQVCTLLQLSGGAYGYEQMIRTEWVVLKKLKFHISMCDHSFFIARLLEASNADIIDMKQKKKIKHLCYYFVDQMMPFNETLNHLPSKLSSAGICLARYIALVNERNVACKPWTNTLQFYSSYPLISLQCIVRRMAKLALYVRSSKYQGAFVKYSSRSRYGNISNEVLDTKGLFLSKVAETGI